MWFVYKGLGSLLIGTSFLVIINTYPIVLTVLSPEVNSDKKKSVLPTIFVAAIIIPSCGFLGKKIFDKVP